ncbi:MAG TPA: GNAT family N-acetyltransferase [Acidothermaceae bacterium]|jgi:GNAT superfamily N-acetyltransferase
MSAVEFTAASVESPDAVALIEAVQQEYEVRYGSRDVSELAVAEFAPPQGVFLVGRDDGEPVACGGLRLVVADLGELKRMYVVPTARRRGIARALLGRLEDEARLLGASRLRLETGLNQPEAIALYESAGYQPTEQFGPYAGHVLARHLAKPLSGISPMPK